MKLNASERKHEKKSETAALRRAGKIPAVLYSPGNPNALIHVDAAEFKAILRGIKQGRLSTTTFVLNIGNKERKAIVKDIQYHPTTYDVIHLDFQELIKGTSVSVKVPISCTGVADCVGIKLGGFLRQVIRTVKVECPSETIPSEFIIDVKDLGIRQTKRLSDLTMPKGVKPLAAMKEVLVVIARR
ncbi:MAG: 50S ribosomal protein L25/general stress protein Ctc [Simkania sp.]|nr:50S ribosomal protein L25/general stress protein Ctc [Simkania sp.]